MNFFKSFHNDISSIVQKLSSDGKLPEGMDPSRLTCEPPRDASHGDVATNAAMVLCKQAKMKPRDLAEILAEEIKNIDHVVSVDVAGPGFINIKLATEFWHARLKDVLAAGLNWGDSEMGKGQNINVEYVSANPTGPMHVGHGRGAVVGDALALLLSKAGYDVTKEYYINDAGAQVDVLARSAYLRYREAFGETIEIPEGLYPGDYLVGTGQQLKEKFGDKWLNADESEWLAEIRAFSIDAMMDLIRNDLAALGVEHNVFSSERELVENDMVGKAIKYLEDRDLVYTGVLEPPKGKKPDDWEPRPQLLFKATDFGDDVDRPLKKSDGSNTYFANDIAYHFDKFSRGADQMIDIFGADHGGYVKRMKAAVKAMSEGKGELDIKLAQMVNLMENGEPVKMSKRAGTFVTLRDVIDKVGKDVVRFIMLTRKSDAQLEFDFTKVVEQSKDNPVFYVQYAHARCYSVFRKAIDEFDGLDLSVEKLATADLSLLNDESELTLMRQMAEWPRLVEAAAESHEPHRITYFLYELASEFHSLWNKGTGDVQLRFLHSDNEDLTNARLALLKAVSLVIASGLVVLGVEPREELR
ncbi:Arginine--tRNA ligase [Candidatus Terasakiella magnetica]|uniref:Arginine--tRNA ligase n=1 Tax=Candidatus Terasakiella magnetica TaxID=1867952 RepID=A0A1C3RCC8_9PROT|nr:arginine--tRNA ligase [Candidatus Terasakiella magnetica]SCA54933.1 Arginine--tRNA ligase [Candidatus Terasakiella magnetica]